MLFNDYCTMAKKIAETQNPENPIVSFVFKGETIINPFVDPTGQYDLSYDEAVNTYGFDNILDFIVDAFYSGDLSWL